ncbi:MAG: pyruvate formate lyase-activating protein [Clostridia bacterium]|nr:pyruvate formate lyase-activating protein [Clostridia bacterium]
MNIIGQVHSIQSLGTVDGPGLRFVVFLQGCNLRCKCCHNPDTWSMTGEKQFAPEEILEKAVKYREYFGDKGGITLTGGEPLLQADFCYEVFKLCHENGINTCLDTSGSILNDSVKRLLTETDRVLLDIKYTNNDLYMENVGCSINKPLEFLEYLNQQKIPTTVRQVIIPTINDYDENVEKLNEIVKKYTCIDKVELLPFKKICQTKYDNMKIEFPFRHLDTPTKETMNKLNKLLK